MRSEKSYTLIGVFVVGAFILMLMGSVFFYYEYVHSKLQMYVMFFKGSLQGLNSTTPVTYRGIKIGEVKLIEVTENRSRNKVMIPVYVEFFVEKNFGFTQNPIHLLISNGYIAQISKPNFISGNAVIELVKDNDRHQIKQVMFHGYPIFPTRNTVDKDTTLDDSIKEAKLTFEAIRKLVSSQEVKDLIKSTQEMTENVDRLAIGIEEYLPRTLVYFNLTMKKIADAASSTQNLTDYLSRNPESVLRGKR
ncbi:membrane protein [Legionella antarctica]|uniref:Membrane protein n=1 Tax=Legionella antarctica TaxID=2708020 RepID=A0A6F8T855_9GAMM|nr:MlaD family protein [Legionella antarctica]BCA96631.1 membrane protein [Legionella antarctica]